MAGRSLPRQKVCSLLRGRRREAARQSESEREEIGRHTYTQEEVWARRTLREAGKRTVAAEDAEVNTRAHR